MKGKDRKGRFRVAVAADECKGCGRCVLECPVKALVLTDQVNSMGCVYVSYVGSCIGCGACFYACPEPGALTVLELEREEEG